MAIPSDLTSILTSPPVHQNRRLCRVKRYLYKAVGMALVTYLASNTSPLLTALVAFDAAPFQSNDYPLRFRSIPDSLAQYHVEASECCLIHYDNPSSSSRGVWINPAVRVGYSRAAYDAVQEQWPTKSELRLGAWKSRWTWWLRDPGSPIKTWYRVRHWRNRNPRIKEPGLACASDLAMVLTSNGWAMRGGRFE